MNIEDLKVYAILDTRSGELTTSDYGRQRRTVYQRKGDATKIANMRNREFQHWYAVDGEENDEPFEVVSASVSGSSWEKV